MDELILKIIMGETGQIPDRLPASRGFLKPLAKKEAQEVSFLQKMLIYCVLPSLLRKTDEDKKQLAIKDTAADPIAISVNDDVKLNGYTCKAGGINNKWLVYFLPNGGTAEDALYEARTLSYELDVNVLVFNYRGVGGSTGFPSTSEDLVEDGAACLDYLKKEQGADIGDIYAYGKSLGGGVAAELLAGEGRGAHLISDRSFTSLGSAIEKLCPLEIIGKIVRGIFEAMGWVLDSISHLKNITGNIFVVSTKNDRIVGECRLCDGVPKGLNTIKYREIEPVERERSYFSRTDDPHNGWIFGNQPDFKDTEKTTQVFFDFIHGEGEWKKRVDAQVAFDNALKEYVNSWREGRSFDDDQLVP